MTQWLIEPRDPMVVRDGRPNRGASQSRTRDFPLPSALAGVMRTRLGSDADGAFEMHADLDALRGVGVRGPVLVELDDDGGAGEPFVPAPLDAVFLERLASAEGQAVELHALGLTQLPAGSGVDPELGDPAHALSDDGDGDLMLLGLHPRAPEGKASRSAPAFWSMPELESWLRPRTLERGCWRRGARAESIVHGLAPLPRELRTHVAIDGSTGTGIDGKLFETDGLRFIVPEGGDTDASHIDASRELRVRRLGLTVDVDELPGRELKPGLFPFAGERRIMRMRSATRGLAAIPDWLDAHLGQGERSLVRVMLLTPALFEGGFQPSESSPLLACPQGMDGVRLVAARTPSPMTVSGWDMAKGRPKPSRRAVPAGAVYWLELRGSPEARRAWAREVWMQNVSCQEQDRLDGWGLAAVGVAEAPRAWDEGGAA